MSGLPNTRRIILSHDPKTGKPAVIDDQVPMQPQESGGSLGVAYTQTTFVGKPENALAGATATPDKMFMHSTGVTSAIIDFKPGQEFPMHYTSSQDYMVLLSGEVELGLSDGTWKTFRQGELIVNAGALHAWRNNTDQWVRILVVSTPSEPQLVNDKPLDEEPIKAMKLF